MLIQYLTLLIHHKYYVEFTRPIAFYYLIFFIVIVLCNTALQVQAISQKSTLPKWTRLDRLDNRSYSTIQHQQIPLILLRLEYGYLCWNSSIYLAKNLSVLHTTNCTKHVKKLNTNHLIGSGSQVTNPSSELTKINVT